MTRALLILFMALIPLKLSYSDDLLDIYNLAVANDPDYKISAFNQQATDEIKSQSIAQMLPHIGTNIQSNYNHFDTTKDFYLGTGVQNFWSHTFGINIKQPIFNWSHWIQLDQSDIQIAQAEAERQTKYQALITRTVTAYFNVLAAQDMLEFIQAEKKAIEKQLERAKLRYEVGRSAMPELYEAQAGYDRSLASEIEAQNQLDNAKEELAEIIGKTPLELSPLQATIPVELPIPGDISEWANNAETHNFAIVAQFNKTKFAQRSIDLQQSRHFPTIDLTAEFKIEDSNSQFGFRGDTFAFGLQINIPLFQGGATESRIRQAKYQYQAAQEELTQVTRNINRVVKDAYRGVMASISQVDAFQVTTKSASLAVESTELGFTSGIRNMIDVLTEQRNLYKAKSDYAKSRYGYLINCVKLKEAIGALSEEDIRKINSYLLTRQNDYPSANISARPETPTPK